MYLPTPVYQIAQIRLLEQKSGIPSEQLMERAKAAAFKLLKEVWPQAQRILILCGPGNNGGDGYMLAHLAHEAGLHVTIWQVGDLPRSNGVAWQTRQACIAIGIPVLIYQPNLKFNADIIIDAIFGIGIRKPIAGEIALLIAKVNNSGIPVLALDCPSGLHADTGQSMAGTIIAHTTITFIGLKLGLLTGQGPHYAGRVSVADLDLPATLFALVTPIAETIAVTPQDFPPRLRDAHKGQFGHVLIIGGDHGMGGATGLAAMAAVRTGAGLVTVATRAMHITSLLSNCPEAMAYAIERPKDIIPLLAKASVIVIGPGLGRSAWGKALRKIVLASKLPLVVDADALYDLTPCKRPNWILTPHPGEAARLLNINIASIQEDRLSAGQKIQQYYGGVCILKGAGTLVVKEASTKVCTAGNPGMASGGMGDVLSGMIGSMIAQGMNLARAAEVSVLIHAMAGDQVAQQGERGMCASDVIAKLRGLVNPSVKSGCLQL